jgi:hypothetical protein
MARVIDFAHSPLRSQALDLYLLSHCHLFVGTSSGPVSVAAQLLNKPALLTNITDWSRMVAVKEGDLTTFKHVFSQSRGRFLSLQEILREPFSVQVWPGRDSEEYVMHECTSEEILAALEESLDDARRSDHTALQLTFRRAINDQIRGWLDAGEPQPAGELTDAERHIERYKIASMFDAKSRVSEAYLERNWERDALNTDAGDTGLE